ncbi:PEP-CTERM sorting domain-containing protein, partial [bacterium]
IYLRSDSDYVYGLLNAATPNTGLEFANLYFSTTMGGSNIGFQISNKNAFVPSTGVNYTENSISFSTNPLGVVEFAIPWDVFVDPNPLGFTPITATNNKLRLNLSQSFGYSVAGGASFYGADRLCVVTYQAVPEPASMAFLGLGGLTLIRRRKKA